MRSERGIQWTRPVGIVLIAWALSLALDPEYPVARDATPVSSAETPAELERGRPVAASPKGRCDRVEEFAWRWDGAPTTWCVVVLDADLDVVHRSLPGADLRLAVDGALRRILARGGRFTWFVESSAAAAVRSAPIAFWIP
jgi:hypothetical protein